MNILYLITGMYNSAGMERTVANKANYFTSHGHDVTIVTTDQKKRPYFYKISSKVKTIDLRLNFSDHDNCNIIIRTLFFWYKKYLFKLRMNEILHRNDYDIVVTLILKSTDFLYKIKDSSVKIVEHHFSREHYRLLHPSFTNGFLVRLAYKYRDYHVIQNLKHYDCFVVLTKEDAMAWGKSLSNVRVIYNSIEYKKGVIADLCNKKVVSVGRLEYQKGYDLLLPIWKQVVKKHPDWNLVIYGAGSLRENLEIRLRDMGLENSVSLCPPTADVESVLLDSSIYVLPSRFEGLPMVLLEAMSLGLPPVAFKCPCGPRDVIIDGLNGFLIKPGDSDAFAERINFLIENPIERKIIGKESKKSMAAFSHMEIGGEWEKLFNELLSKKA